MKTFPLLIAVATITAAAQLHAADADRGDARSGFTLSLTGGEHLDVFYDGRILGRFMFAHDPSTPERREETYKPYLHIFDPSGEKPITKGPGGQFTHHRGIFFGYSKLEFDGRTYDRWHMKDGEQVHQGFVRKSAGDDDAALTSAIHWNDEQGQPILTEERTLRFLLPPEGAYALVEMDTTLSAPRGEVILDGDPEHAGAQFRPADEVDGLATVYVFPGKGTDPREDRDLPWVGETFSLDGKKYSVVILNHPGNPADTVFSAYRDYGRFGAFPVGTVAVDGTFTLRYRWLIAEGEMLPASAIQNAWNAFADRNDPAASEITIRAAETKAKKPAKPKK